MRAEIITVFCLVVLIYTAYWTMESFGRVRRRFYTSLSYAVPSEPNVSASAAQAQQPAAQALEPEAHEPTPVTSKTIEERCKQNKEPYYSEERCVSVNTYGKNNISSDLKAELLSKSLSDSEYSFCRDDTFNKKTIGMFGPKGNGLRDCLRYEEALKERCKEDFGPYDSKNECILVNLYGVDYDSFRNYYNGERFNDLQKMIGHSKELSELLNKESLCEVSDFSVIENCIEIEKGIRSNCDAGLKTPITGRDYPSKKMCYYLELSRHLQSGLDEST